MTATTPGDGAQVHRQDVAVSDAAHPERGIERVGGKRDIVDVHRLPADVEMRAFVRNRVAGDDRVLRVG